MKGTTQDVKVAMRRRPPTITKQVMEATMAAVTSASRPKASFQASAIELLCTPGQKKHEARIVTIANAQA